MIANNSKTSLVCEVVFLLESGNDLCPEERKTDRTVSASPSPDKFLMAEILILKLAIFSRVFMITALL